MSNSNPSVRRVRLKDKTGMKFGKLTAKARLKKRGGKQYWLCECECGTLVEAEGDSLRNGSRYACPDCTKPVRYAKSSKAIRRHGQSKSPLFYAWEAMKQRCSNPKVACYERYGGRGIRVCDRWANSFEAFLEDMGERPEGMELDRIDNDGPYSPENCRWASKKKQGRNKRNNRLITHNGETLTLAEWCEKLGLDYKRTLQRLTRDKWTAERAFSILPL